MRGGGPNFWDGQEENCPLEVTMVRTVGTFPAGLLKTGSCLEGAQ